MTHNGPAACRRLAERDNGSWPALLGSVDLHVGRPDHLAPLLGFFGDELAKVSRRSCKRHGAQVGKPRLDLGIAETGVDLLVELLDDLCGGVLGRPDSRHPDTLLAWQNLAS